MGDKKASSLELIDFDKLCDGSLGEFRGLRYANIDLLPYKLFLHMSSTQGSPFLKKSGKETPVFAFARKRGWEETLDKEKRAEVTALLSSYQALVLNKRKSEGLVSHFDRRDKVRRRRYIAKAAGKLSSIPSENVDARRLSIEYRLLCALDEIKAALGPDADCAIATIGRLLGDVPGASTVDEAPVGGILEDWPYQPADIGAQKQALESYIPGITDFLSRASLALICNDYVDGYMVFLYLLYEAREEALLQKGMQLPADDCAASEDDRQFRASLLSIINRSIVDGTSRSATKGELATVLRNAVLKVLDTDRNRMVMYLYDGLNLKKGYDYDLHDLFWKLLAVEDVADYL